jgi:hypothetical protein
VGTKVTVLGKLPPSVWTLKNCLKMNHYLQFCIVAPVYFIFTHKTNTGRTWLRSGTPSGAQSSHNKIKQEDGTPHDTKN